MNLPTKIGQPRFLSKDEVITLHQLSLDAFGGAPGFLNEAALDSSLAQPRQGVGSQYAHEFPFGMAAAYGFHIAMNHAFRDGNKRTAFAATVAFLRINGWNFQMPDASAADMMLDLIANRRDKVWLSAELEEHSKPRTIYELRDFFAAYDVRKLIDLGKHTSHGGPNAQAEFDATLDEAKAAIPAIEQLKFQYLEHKDAGNTEGATRVLFALLMLTSMHRHAEDAGYEW